ncbi:MAG: T9SS type A sorting domain-containing protein [Candidatus Marinimicrobia bacterium]|nr:T9SS type A sorting domain-containing protein [Candidatus Neomarinimicrobiota bacterium]MBT3676352.1 T9SS type A sorting domain-containing protein [Candidatus Neomarinimicrobiota bacterium]MBT3763078.1 T9SS type A sorting domain-containing protein [Candidatus Neomarinimicrobiota bacterium]MBT4067098.1 T9SS type A sorting domain-containing protein [Candidatus Neomarinimicrobiota bacterium]MBT4270457.1 T9SS type A sorting domain-containing protein [Candidatus Neomarinimicrobiota bacterium]
MKPLLSISLFILSLGTAQILGDDFYTAQSNEFCSMQNRAIESNRLESIQNPLDLKPFGEMPTLQKLSVGADYTLSDLSGMTIGTMITLLDTIDYSQVKGLFTNSDESKIFYGDSVRFHAMIDSLVIRAEKANSDSDLGVQTLVEIVRSGYFLAFYSPNDYTYLTQKHKEKTWSAQRAFSGNTNLDFGTSEQVKAVTAFGALMGIGSIPVEVFPKVDTLLKSFQSIFDSNLSDWYKSNALYWLGGGVDYGIFNHWQFNGRYTGEDSPYFGLVDSVFQQMDIYATTIQLTKDNEWLINNSVYWGARIGLHMPIQSARQFLSDVITYHGKWTAPSLNAVQYLDFYYNGIDEDGNPIDVVQIKKEVEAQLLPNTIRFDDSKIIVRYGDGVELKKIKTLYWAMKEVEAQFYRIVMNDHPLAEGHADDSLTAYIYNSPSDYSYNNFLFGLSTNNGGMYIESWGSFFTYERTPQESTLTLEELFRHEYVHYLQGRYLEPGLWWQHDIYDNERLTWFGEGSAEYFAGSTRLNGINTRHSIVNQISVTQSERMSLPEVVKATYSSGWSFYRYGAALFDYLYTHDLGYWLEMNQLVMAGNGTKFDSLMTKMAGDASLNEAYQSHMDSLVTNLGSFKNPETSDDYLNMIQPISFSQILTDVQIAIQVPRNHTYADNANSPDHSIIQIKGNVNLSYSDDPIKNWVQGNSFINESLISLSSLSWPGYQTYSGWFSEPKSVSIGNGEEALLYEITFQGIYGSEQILSISDKILIPEKITLHQNFPNPFNPSTTIQFDLTKNSQTSLVIYNILGGEVETLVNDHLNSGNHIFNWNGGNNPAGMYFARLIIEGETRTMKMLYLK